MKGINKRLSLTLKFVPPIVIGILAIQVIGASVQLNVVKRGSQEQVQIAASTLNQEQQSFREVQLAAIDSKSRMLGQFLAKVAPDFITSFDFESLNSFRVQAEQDADVVYVAFLNSEGQQLAGADIPGNPSQLVEKRYPIVLDGQDLGVVVVGLSTARVSSAVDESNARVVQAITEARLAGESVSDHFAMVVATAVLIIVLFISMMVFFLFRVFVVNPLQRTVNVLERMAVGDLSQRLELDSQDEMGGMAAALNRAIEGIRNAVQADSERSAAELRRINQALDSVSSKVMVTDAQYNIVYLNNSARRMFENVESDIRQNVQGFGAHDLVGSNISMFETGSGHWHEVQTVERDHDGEFNLGSRIFHTVSNAVSDQENERIGTVIEWNDRTQEHAVENEVEGIVSAARAGDLTQRIEIGQKSGFFASLSSGINELLGVCEQVIGDVVRVFGDYAEGDFTQRINTDYHGAFGELKRHANTTASKLHEITDKISVAANMVSTGADDISRGNLNLNQRTEEQAASLDETSANMEEMTSTVHANAEHAQRANALATDARTQAEQGSAIVDDANKAMMDIEQASQKIANIIGVIDDIAFQTNLLALNAAVESARAGEHGRGFAVVASEVRTLAQRCADAAKEIKSLIEDSVAKVHQGSQMVDESGTTLQKIVKSVKEVSHIIAEIAAAGHEQSDGIVQVNSTIAKLDVMTKQNAAMVEQVSTASQAMEEQARKLNELISFFRSGDAESGKDEKTCVRAAS